MFVCLLDFGHVVDNCIFQGLSSDFVDGFHWLASKETKSPEM